MRLTLHAVALDGPGAPVPAGEPGQDPLEHLFRASTGEARAWLDGGRGGTSLLALGTRPWAQGAPRDLAQLRDELARLEPAGAPPPGPFAGGFVGALAYELGVAGEDLVLPAPVHPVPPIVGGLVSDFAVRSEGRAWLVTGELEGLDAPGRALRRREELLELLRREPPAEPDLVPEGPLVEHRSGADHRAGVEALRAAIGRGDLYQANLARRYSRRLRGSPRALYRRLRRSSPAPSSGYLEWDGAAGRSALLSASPELLLEVQGRYLRTCPIKGTLGRSADPEEDARRARALLASAKDRAELAMIVDLERNDLGRVARPGSVRVGEFPRLASFASVHHLLADVEAELEQGRDALDALAALFPGGSITGAPKLAAMEHLADLEGQGRGLFTGSLGFLDLRGAARFNILIRTLVWHADDDGSAEVEFHVGGGITWRSDPAAEEEETRVKGAALAALLHGAGEEPDTLGVELRAVEPVP